MRRIFSSFIFLKYDRIERYLHRVFALDVGAAWPARRHHVLLALHVALVPLVRVRPGFSLALTPVALNSVILPLLVVRHTRM